jgi:uncharacterized repeat protein (TIGR01451 family)
MIRRILLALVLLLIGSPALAQSCDTANRFSFSFSNQAAATLAYGSTYNYTAVSGSGATRPFSVQIAQNGLSSTQAGGNQMPAISTLVTGPDATKRDLVIGGVFSSRTADINSATRVITVTLTFATPIRDMALTVHDIDFTSNQYRDWLGVSGSNGTSTYTGSLALAAGANSAVVGPASSPVSVAAGQAVGSAGSTNNSDNGTLLVSFAQPVTSVTLKYGNYPLQLGELTTGQQAMGIAGFSFCPLPSIALAKTSAPASSTLGAFNLPDNDVVYTLTVTNSGGSSVDAGSIVLNDVMPASVTFRNRAFDGTTSLPVKLVGAAGVSLTSANLTYRRTGTSTFNYTPASGYDPLVAEVRVTPTGTLAANSSFSIQFAAQIK